MIRDRIILGIRQSETRQELLKIRRLSLDVCADFCRAAESAISHRTVLDDVCEPVHVVNNGRLLKRDTAVGVTRSRKKCALHMERPAIIVGPRIILNGSA